MKICNGFNEAVLRTWERAIGSDPCIDSGSLARPALTPVILTVQTATFGISVGLAPVPALAEEPVPPSSLKLKSLLAEAMLDKAVSKHPVLSSGPSISAEVAISAHSGMTYR